MNYQIADLSSFEIYHAGSKARVSRLAPNAQMRPSAKGASFLQESGSQLPIEILYFLSWKTQFAAQ